MVPTAELEIAGGEQRGQEHGGGGGAKDRRERRIGGLDFGDVAVAGWKALAAVITIAMLTRPATVSATITSTLEKRTQHPPLPSSRGARARCVSPECRKIACGMTVAPTMPTASVSAAASGSLGVTMPRAA